MKESEYILLTDLAKLRIAKAAVSDTMPRFWPNAEEVPPTALLEAAKALDKLIEVAQGAVEEMDIDHDA